MEKQTDLNDSKNYLEGFIHFLDVLNRNDSVDAMQIKPTSLHVQCDKWAPDPWEEKILRSAISNGEEFHEFLEVNDRPYLRYLKTARFQEHCYQCHSQQRSLPDGGYWAMGISLPLSERMSRHKKNLYMFGLWHLVFYLTGAAVMLWGIRHACARIREQNQAEEILEARELLFRTVADNTYAWEYWINPDGTFRYISPAIERITGYPREKFLQEPEALTTLLLEGDQEIFRDHIKNSAGPEEKCECDFQIRTRDGVLRWLHHICRPVYDTDGTFLGRRASNYDITDQKTGEIEREKLIAELQSAAKRIKILAGFIPICANCKKIRDDRGFWKQVEQYVEEHSNAVFSHGICPDCCRKLYPDIFSEEELASGNEP